MGKAKSGKKQDNAKAVRQLSLPPFPVPLRILISRPLPRRRQRRPRRPSRRQRRPRRTRSRSRRRRARRRTRRTRWTRATFCARSRSTARSGQRSTRSRVRPRLARSHRARCNGAKLTAPPPPSLSAEDIVEGPPSRRANATLTASPVADHLYLFGGEYYDGQRVELFADVRPSVLFPRCCANLALTLVVVAAAVPVRPGQERVAALHVADAAESSSGARGGSDDRWRREALDPRRRVLCGALLPSPLFTSLSHAWLTLFICSVQLRQTRTRSTTTTTSGPSRSTPIRGSAGTSRRGPLLARATAWPSTRTSSSSLACVVAAIPPADVPPPLLLTRSLSSQGFQDTGIRTTYLNDLWAWSLTECVALSPSSPRARSPRTERAATAGTRSRSALPSASPRPSSLVFLGLQPRLLPPPDAPIHLPPLQRPERLLVPPHAGRSRPARWVLQDVREQARDGRRAQRHVAAQGPAHCRGRVVRL